MKQKYQLLLIYSRFVSIILLRVLRLDVSLSIECCRVNKYDENT
jgi:hypothetical protein